MQVRFFFGIQLQAQYLPWVLCLFNMIVKGGGMIELIGIFVGHVYYFLKFRYAQDFGGPDLLKTPQVIKYSKQIQNFYSIFDFSGWLNIFQINVQEFLVLEVLHHVPSRPHHPKIGAVSLDVDDAWETDNMSIREKIIITKQNKSPCPDDRLSQLWQFCDNYVFPFSVTTVV